MKLCKINYNLSFELSGSCGDCPRKFIKKEVYSLKDVVPLDLCPFAYFSIIPYWVSLMQGAKFPWRGSETDVICQCPAPNGIVFLIRKIEKNGSIIVEAEVIDIGKAVCLCQYFVGKKFIVDEKYFCPAIFPSLWLQLDRLNGPLSRGLDINCCVSHGKYLLFSL